MSNTNDLINAAIPTNALFPMPLWGGFVASSPVIPQLYWDVYSSEQRWKTISCDIKKLVEYVNQQTFNLNDVDERQQQLDSQLTGVLNSLDAMQKQLNAFEEYIQNIIDGLVAGASVWDVTQGKYSNSVIANRNMYHFVTVHAYTINEFNEIADDMTCEQLANGRLNTRGFAVQNVALFDNQKVISYYANAEYNN